MFKIDEVVHAAQHMKIMVLRITKNHVKYLMGNGLIVQLSKSNDFLSVGIYFKKLDLNNYLVTSVI